MCRSSTDLDQRLPHGKAGANQAPELAFTLADGKGGREDRHRQGPDVDEFAGCLSFFCDRDELYPGDRQDARGAPAVVPHHEGLRREEPEEPDAAHPQPDQSAGALTEQDPYNNVVRTTIEAMAAVFGGTQSSAHQQLRRGHRAAHRVQFARIARNTQLIIREETITSVVDPGPGSYLEKPDAGHGRQAWAILDEVEAMGGMTQGRGQQLGQAEDRGQRGREAGPHRQREGRDRRRQQVPLAKGRPIETSWRWTTSGARARCADQADHSRAAMKVPSTRRWPRYRAARRTNSGQPAGPSDRAIRLRHGGEVSDALEKRFGRHRADIQKVTGVYAAVYDSASEGLGQRSGGYRRLRRNAGQGRRPA